MFADVPSTGSAPARACDQRRHVALATGNAAVRKKG
jgi:hypothetical protein